MTWPSGPFWIALLLVILGAIVFNMAASALYASLDLPDWLRSGIDTILVSTEDNASTVDQGSIVAGVMGGLFGLIGGLFAWFLLPFFLFCLLKDQPSMSADFYARVPAPWKHDISRMLTITVGNFAQYFKAEFVVGSIMFAIVTVGMFAVGVVMDAPLLTKFAILVGLIALVMELILRFGPILVPNLEGKMISFSGASVLVFLAIGFALPGIIGAILALPVASIVRDLFRHFFDKAVADDLVYDEVEPLEGVSGA